MIFERRPEMPDTALDTVPAFVANHLYRDLERQPPLLQLLVAGDPEFPGTAEHTRSIPQMFFSTGSIPGPSCGARVPGHSEDSKSDRKRR